MKKEKGFVLVMILLISTVLVILIPSLVLIMRQESRMTVKHKRSSAAFHLAEAGTDRGMWKIKENLDIWGQIADGPIDGYNFDETYEMYDDDNKLIGSYKIKLTTGSTESQRKIISIGKDNTGNEVRKIEIVVGMASITSSVTAPTIHFQGSCAIHWGPMASLDTLTLQGAAAGKNYPRKIARGDIIGKDGNGSTLPNDDIDGSGFWEWKSYYNVPDTPDIDLASYMADAIAENNYYAGYKEFKNITSISHSDSDQTYYVGGDCVVRNSYIKGELIVIGNLNFWGNGKGSYNADIPADALDQYQKCAGYPDPADMPGHPGPPTVTTYGIVNVAFEGFVYVGGNLSSHGTPTVNGIILTEGSTVGAGNLVVYYNDEVAVSARTITTDMSTISWEETPGQW